MANKKKQSNERPQKMADSQPRVKVPKTDIWMRAIGYFIMVLLAIGMVAWTISVFL